MEVSNQQPAELATQAQADTIANQIQTNNQVEQQTAAAPLVNKPISQIDKLKLMIIRIGDELRHNRDEHLQKLKTQFVSPFVLKEKTHRHTLTETLISCIHCMPHKVNLYSSLLALVAIEDFDFAADLIRQIVESLHQVLVIEGNVFASKNVMRLLGNLMQFGLIGTEAFCQFLLQLVEEFQKIQEQAVNFQPHSTDMMLEVILASLPATAQKLSREQSIDFGTVLESLKAMLKNREKNKTHFMPLKDSANAANADLLMKMWEAFQSNNAKVFVTEDVLISASKKLFVEIAGQISQIGKQIDGLPQVYLAEFRDTEFKYTLQNAASYSFQKTRLRKYRSPFVLGGLVGNLPDKYQAVLAIEIAFALINTFQESHEMAGSNLLNMYLSEEYRDYLPQIILTAIFSLTIQADKPFIQQTVFYTILVVSLLEQSKSIETLKKFKSQMEELFVKFVFNNIQTFNEYNQRRAVQFLALLLSQTAGRDLGQTEPLLLKLTEGNLKAPQVDYLKKVFAQLCRLCFPKKVWEQLDPKFHYYLPAHDQANLAFMQSANDPELQILTDALVAKEPDEKLLELIQNGGVFVQAILTRTKKSLEHLKTSVERYNGVFEYLFVGLAGQKEIIQQVINVFAKHDPDKAEKVLQKLSQIKCVSNVAIIEWACNSIETKKGVVSWSDVSLEFDIIQQALQRECSMKWLTVTEFQQNPPRRMDEDGDDEDGKKDMKMENDPFDDPEYKQHDQMDGGPPAKRRLTLQEYEDQYAGRMASEIYVFSTTLKRLDKHAEKNEFMKDYILHILKFSETSFITPKGKTQCIAQTIVLQNQQMQVLARLI